MSLRDLKGDLLIMPAKDLLPSVHQMIVAAYLKNHMPLDRYQMAEHFQTGVNLTKARVWCQASGPAGVLIKMMLTMRIQHRTRHGAVAVVPHPTAL